ncbi:MAG: hypothetical protein HZA62_01640 [Rhodocyclales bacterium]|nr:hypothetical protein [Rhodocyclales bacterium]
MHLIAVGFMLQAMSGAMFQFIPVAVGGNVWRSLWVANAIQPLLILGALLLVAGFHFSAPVLLSAAVPALLAGVGIFVGVVLLALWRTPATGMTLWTMRIAVAGLAVTVLLGALLAEALARGLDLPIIELTNVHLAWGLGGWALMLVAAVSYFVVPMFQLTNPYPLWFARWFGPLLLVMLLLWSGLWFRDDLRPAQAFGVPVSLLCVAFASMTLRLQYTRRRKINDATSLNFRVAMIALLVFAISGTAMAIDPTISDDPRAAVWLGMLVFPGVFVSTISGMMYKIIPFLNWLHLQRLGAPISAVPNMKKMIPGDSMTAQFRLHVLAVLLLLAAVWLPSLAEVAGLVFSASCAWLAWNLTLAMRSYRRFRDQIRASVLRC